MLTTKPINQWTKFTRFMLDQGVTIDQVGSNQWKIQARSGLPGLDLSKPYTSYDEAVAALVSAAGIDVNQTAAA